MTCTIRNKIKVTIRTMTEDDLSEVLLMENEIFLDPWSEQFFIDQFTDDGWASIVAENDGVIIGYVCYYVVPGDAHLTNIAVKEEFRRKSVAKQLLENILLIASDNECEFVLLEVRPSNLDAICFYEKFGFKILYRRSDYYHNPAEDAYVMVRYFKED